MSDAPRRQKAGRTQGAGRSQGAGRTQKIGAQRAAARRAEKRRRLLIASGGVVIVIALVVALIVVKLGASPVKAAGSASNPQISKQITSVSAATFNEVGAGTATGLKAVSGQPELTVNGKPEILYIGGEYCPYCAAERWALATAVSRFGTLTAPNLIHSSATDVYPNTPTLSFVGSSYTSSYIAFTPVEWYGEQTDASTPFGHVYLQQPTQQEQALFTEYAGGSIPFVDIANRYILPSVQYIPSDLAGMSWAQVASAMHDPSSTVAKDIDGAANVLTAALCKVTTGPAGLCTSAGVQAAAKSL
jgi:thiol-disulfide isomerase/thioredoxin